MGDPPTPTGWARRWPPSTTPACTSQTPTAVIVHRGALFVGTSCGEIFRSDDEGRTYTLTPAPFRARVWKFAQSGNTLLAGHRGAGMARSTDGGATWENFNGTLTGFHALTVGDVHVVGADVYIATFGAGVMTTPVVGAPAWTSLNTETADVTLRSPSSTCANTPGYLDPITGQPMTFLHGYSLTDDGSYLYYGNKCGGVYRTSLTALPGAAAWETYAAGLPYFYSYYQDPFGLAYDGSYAFVGVDDEGGYRTDPAAPAAWTRFTDNGFTQPQIDVTRFDVTSGAIYAGTNYGGLYVSRDHGATWTAVNGSSYLDFLGGGFDTINDLGHDASHVYAAVDMGVYVSQ